jgi:hypothetical protein
VSRKIAVAEIEPFHVSPARPQPVSGLASPASV